MTVFTPISIAAKLAPSNQIFMSHLREHTEKVNYALNVITETFIAFAQACLDRGASGLFFATTDWASRKSMSWEEYRSFACPYDLRILNSVSRAELNVLHVCEPQNFLNHLGDYPVHAFNWDARAPGNLSLGEGKAILKGKTVMGGMAQGKAMTLGTPEQITGEVVGLRVAMGKKGWILSPGCTFVPETPDANITAIRRAITRDLAL
jgi:uroporphyrinogen decarboxylase